MKNRSTKTCAELLAQHDWQSEMERADDKVDFLVHFLERALGAVAVAAFDQSLRPEQRTAAGYAFSCTIRKAAHLAEKALLERHEELPDLGLQDAVADAVAALHRVATRSPRSFQNLTHFTRWPILIAADRSPLSTCVMPEELGQGTLGATATGFVLRANTRRSPALGTKWNRLALCMRERTDLRTTPLQPPRGENIAIWAEWIKVKAELQRYQADVMRRPDIEKWANGPRLSKLKPNTVWAELKKEVQRALLTLARNNSKV